MMHGCALLGRCEFCPHLGAHLLKMTEERKDLSILASKIKGYLFSSTLQL